LYQRIKSSIMEVAQFIGFLIFLSVFTLGFWLMLFLISFVIPYWLGGYFLEEFKLKKEAKRLKKLNK